MISKHQLSDYDFELFIDGLADITSPAADALFEAGCDDALLGSRAGNVSLTFTREAPSFKDAVLSAISNVHSANINATVLSVEAEESTDSTDLEDLTLINQMLELFRPATKLAN